MYNIENINFCGMKRRRTCRKFHVCNDCIVCYIGKTSKQIYWCWRKHQSKFRLRQHAACEHHNKHRINVAVYKHRINYYSHYFTKSTMRAIKTLSCSPQTESLTIPTHRKKEEKGKTVEDNRRVSCYRRNKLALESLVNPPVPHHRIRTLNTWSCFEAAKTKLPNLYISEVT